MMIYDHVTKEYEKVDNLPYGFAVPVGYLGAVDKLVKRFCCFWND